MVALLGFQLAMVLMETFPLLPHPVQMVHLVSLAFVALATVVLMSPGISPHRRATLAVFYSAWFGAMLLLRRRRSGELRAKQA